MARIHRDAQLQAAVELTDVHLVMARISRRAGRTARQRIRRLAGDVSRRKEEVFTGLAVQVPAGSAVAVIPAESGVSSVEFMRLCAGTLLPDRGHVVVRDPMVAMLPKSGLLNESLTVRQNIYMAGIQLGMSPQDVASRLDWIVQFAGLERSLDAFTRRCPPRLRQRIAWTVTMATGARAFAIQRALVVADEAFREKCWDHLAGLRQDGVTFLVDDADSALIRFCDRALLLRHDRLQWLDSVQDATRARIRTEQDASSEEEPEERWESDDGFAG